jgi:1-acyl-sn-glycerol-3-phosphate acyltransferase
MNRSSRRCSFAIHHQAFTIGGPARLSRHAGCCHFGARRGSRGDDPEQHRLSMRAMAQSRTRPTLAQRLFSAWAWTMTALAAILGCIWMAVVYVFTVPFDPGRYAVGRWFRRTAVLSVKINPLWSFHVSGVRIRDPRRPYVAVANHESFADIFLISHLPWEMKWLSKEDNFRIPVLGWMMRMAGDIEVRRKDPRSRARAIQECRDRLRKKVSVIILPEGTRSATGEMLPFHDGAFRLAIEMGVPILPMAVAGARHAMPKGSLLFNRARAEVRVLEPIETTGLTAADVPEVRERVRSLIEDTRNTLFREMGLPIPGAALPNPERQSSHPQSPPSAQ